MAILRNLGLMTALMVSPLAAVAHHGSSGQFDTSTTVELSGEITRIRLVNPHAYVYFDSTDENGETVNLRCELQSGSLLKRNGWTTDMFEIGSTISIIGSPDRTDPTTCYMSQVTFENGVVATRYSKFDDQGAIEAEQRQTERDDGTPNIDGNWAMVREAGAPPGGGGRSTVELTEAGAAAIEGATADDNPRYQCAATNIVMDWWFDQMVNTIEQGDDQITMTYGFMDLERTIYLDGTEMPDDYVAHRAGFSTGEWDDETLVVTTTGFDEGWINAPMSEGEGPGSRPEGDDGDAADRPAGPEGAGGPPSPVKNSPELIVTETFTLNDDGTVLTRNYTFEDPLYLEAPISGSDAVTLTNDAYEDYACDDLTEERSESAE
ncbi:MULTISPECIES: DUF6152 family protein [Pacificibacter]|uniref:DUF6152 family protein n=1 Tax=Pacificibacter TaxID=1042323 RepID=UPI001C087A0E|nr:MULTISPECIES: DUF6152 family protein [Pacificibacter]MBU2936790.1 hypothetical protein [Pacificibacter marinus]MDO6614782.1 DUF6152 family protein [Pacificibacter sp. 1_MG-2023]